MPRLNQVGPSELPPSGDERREELKRRADTLAEVAETSGIEREAVDPHAFDVDNEIAQRQPDALEIAGALPEYHYAWENYISQHGLAVRRRQADGYEIVCGEMPECPQLRDEIGRRRWGDTVLMRVKLDRYVKNVQRDNANRFAREGGHMTNLEDMAEQHRGMGVRVGQMSESQMARLATRQAAQQIAGQRLNSMLRNGTMPGLKPGR